jgi:hypothetical protein
MVDRHGERGASDAGNPRLGAEVGQPVPREDPFNSHDTRLTLRRHEREHGVWLGRHLARPHDVAILVQEADRQGPGVPVDAPVKVGWCGVEAPEGSSSSVGCWPNASRPRR